MLNNNKGSSYENSKKKNKKMSLKQKGQLKDVCIAKATGFPRNCGSLPLLLGDQRAVGGISRAFNNLSE